jgi:hypothetical protein
VSKLKLTEPQQKLLDFLKRHPNQWHSVARDQTRVAKALSKKIPDVLTTLWGNQANYNPIDTEVEQ